jgi:hypothetical protein
MSIDRFCTSPKYFPKLPNQHLSLYFGNLAPLNPNSKREDFIQGYLFLEK